MYVVRDYSFSRQIYRGLSESYEADYRKPGELFSQETLEADVAKLHHLPAVSPFLESDSYLWRIIIPTVSLSNRRRLLRRIVRELTFVSNDS